jgi:hypothetical protein
MISGTLTRINNNQITDAISGNVYFGINANTKVQPYSVTSTLLANNLTYGSDLTITGNLSVSGNVTAIDTTNVTIEDPLLLLASNQTGSPTLDIGYIGQRGTSNNIAFVWDESLTSFVTVYTDSRAGDNTNINILSYADIITGNANVTGNLKTGNVSITGNVTSPLNVTGNVIAGNVVSVGIISATGNIAGNNFNAANTISATGNITTAGYFVGTFAGSISGNVTAPGANTQVLFNNSGNLAATAAFTFNTVGNLLTVSGNTSSGNLLTAGQVSATGNIYGGNLSVTGVTADTGNITGGNILTTGTISATGNITANASSYFIGNGSQLTGISSTAGTALTNGNTNITTALNGNANITISGTSNVVVITTAGINVTGNVSANGNVIGGNIATAGVVSAAGNVTGGNILTAGIMSSTGNAIYGNISTAGLVTATGNVTGGNILTANSISAGGNVNAIGNIITSGFVSATGNLQSSGNLSVAGNATIVGSLNVQGNVTFIGSNVITTNDLYIELANNQSTYANINNAGLAVGPVGAVLTYWQYQNSSNAWSTNVGISATANVTSGNLVTPGIVTATGNIIGGNLVTNGLISSTGNLTGGNINTANTISATGNITTAGYFVGAFAGSISGNITAPGANTQVLYNNSGNAAASAAFTFNQATNVITVSGNTSTGNLLTGGIVSATGNVLTAGYLSATGNVYGNNFITAGSGGNISGANVISGTTINATTVSASGNVYGNNLIVANIESVTGNITGGNILTSGIISAVGNITANTGSFLIGDGAYISNINAANVSTVKISNAGSYANVVSANGNIVIAIGSSSNVVATFYDRGVNIANNISVTGNIIPGSAILAPSDNSVNIGNSSAAFATTYTYGISTTNTANARVTVNPSLYNTNFAVNGSTANVLYVDSNTNTVEIGNSRVTTGATLAINATDSILLPVGNTTQRPSSPSTGMFRWNTSLSYLEVWNGVSWTEVGAPAFTVIQNEQFNGDGSTTAFTLASSQTTDSCIVTINGIVQIPTTAYSVSGVYPTCVLTFTEAPVTGDTIDVREITTTTTVRSISNSSANAVMSVNDASPNVSITGSLVVDSGAGYIYGDGTYLTNVGGGNIVATRIQSGNSQVNIASPGGNIYMAVGNANIVSISSTQTTISGNITGGNLSVGTGRITVGNIVNSGASATGNIGTAAVPFNTVFAQSTSALYADLAELYLADDEYVAGTVVSFGGEFEVTASVVDSDARVAGIVSTNPSYLMNSGLTGENVVAVALQGRVPCSVTGTVAKGDMLVSNGDGTARAEINPAVGTVIGKSLADFDGEIGIIEVVVGIR